MDGKNQTILDDDYITLYCKYIINGSTQEVEHDIMRLAMRGNMDAMQLYYTLKSYDAESGQENAITDARLDAKVLPLIEQGKDKCSFDECLTVASFLLAKQDGERNCFLRETFDNVNSNYETLIEGLTMALDGVENSSNPLLAKLEAMIEQCDETINCVKKEVADLEYYKWESAALKKAYAEYNENGNPYAAAKCLEILDGNFLHETEDVFNYSKMASSLAMFGMKNQTNPTAQFLFAQCVMIVGAQDAETGLDSLSTYITLAERELNIDREDCPVQE